MTFIRQMADRQTKRCALGCRPEDKRLLKEEDLMAGRTVHAGAAASMV